MTDDTEKLDEMAEKAVRLLGLGKAIDNYAEDLYERLLEADKQAAGAPVNADMMFVALCLPMVNGLIHFASTRVRLAEALAWVRQQWGMESGEADPLSTLSALTLIYIVNNGSASLPAERRAWERIRKRVHRLKEDMEESVED